MALPFKPEPFDHLKSRFKFALANEWDGPTLAEHPDGPRPGVFRRHVFDFEDGFRMIASVEKILLPPMRRPERYLHLSFSFRPGADSGCPVDRLNWLLFSFAGTRKLLREAPNRDRSVAHYLYEYP